MKLLDKLAPLEAEDALDELVTADEATIEEEPAFVEVGTTEGPATEVVAFLDAEDPNDCAEEKVLTAREPLDIVPVCAEES